MPNTVRVPFGSPDYPPDRRGVGDAFGICHEPPHGVVKTRIDNGETIAHIGQLVTLDGDIHVIPRHDLTAAQWRYLNAAAEDAFFSEPSDEAHWVPVVVGHRPGWATAITVTASLTRGSVASLPFPESRAADRSPDPV